VEPQATPSWAASVWIAMVRVCVPVPHVSVQGDHALQPPGTQSTGQSWELHTCSSSRSGHPTPPYAAPTMTFLQRLCVPSPHSFEQACQDNHALMTQSTGHDWVWHASVLVMAPHGRPQCSVSPYMLHVWAVVTVRVCMRTPVTPQETEHVPHACHSESWQSTGHAQVLHVTSSEMEGHAAPPQARPEMMVLWRVSDPDPHGTEHCVKAVHSETTQSTSPVVPVHGGQVCVLHDAVFTVVGQATPP
jgi:hypothetical protein